MFLKWIYLLMVMALTVAVSATVAAMVSGMTGMAMKMVPMMKKRWEERCGEMEETEEPPPA